MGLMYSWSNIKRVLFSVAKLLAYMYTYTHTRNKINFSLCSGWFPWLLCILETSQNPAAVLFTLYMYIATGIRTWSLFFISILLGLGTPLIVPLLCTISPLSSQGTKTRTRHGDFFFFFFWAQWGCDLFWAQFSRELVRLYEYSYLGPVILSMRDIH